MSRSAPAGDSRAFLSTAVDGSNHQSQLKMPRSVSRVLYASLCGLLLIATSGCSFYKNSLSSDRLDKGLTIILPGIEGKNMTSGNIARGLEWGGVKTAIGIHDWTTGIPPLLLVHLRDSKRHLEQATLIASEIVVYQEKYPGRPVFLVGHSGGGGIALMTLEQLPADHPITAVLLLAPGISPEYPIDSVLAKTERGIWNYYSPLDVPVLVVGTTIAGTLDGKQSPSAGAVGFKHQEPDPAFTGPRLTQVVYSPRMLMQGNAGGHLGWTVPSFVSRTLAPVINGHSE